MKEKVLVISRSPSLKKLVQRDLAAEEIEVTTAGELPDIYAFAKSSQPNVIVYDLVNPVKDEFIRIHGLKSHENLRGTPVIFIAGTPRLLYRYQLLGPRDAFVTRYFESKLLVNKIKELLGQPKPRGELEEIPAEAYATELWEETIFDSLEREEPSWAQAESGPLPGMADLDYTQALMAPAYWDGPQLAELELQVGLTLEPALLLAWAMAPAMEEELDLATADEEELDSTRFMERMKEFLGRWQPTEEIGEVPIAAYRPDLWEEAVPISQEREEAIWADLEREAIPETEGLDYAQALLAPPYWETLQQEAAPSADLASQVETILEPALQQPWEMAPFMEEEPDLAVAREEELDWARFMEKMEELSAVSPKRRVSKYETPIEALQEQIKSLEQQLLKYRSPEMGQLLPPIHPEIPRELGEKEEIERILAETYATGLDEEVALSSLVREGEPWAEVELQMEPLRVWGIRKSEFQEPTRAELGPEADLTLEPSLQLAWEVAPLMEEEPGEIGAETYAPELWYGTVFGPLEREMPTWAGLELQMEPTLEPGLQLAWELAPLLEEELALAFATEERVRARLEISLAEEQVVEIDTRMEAFPPADEAVEFSGMIESPWALSSLEMGDAGTEPVFEEIPIFGPLESAEAEEQERVLPVREAPIPEPHEEKRLEEEARPVALPPSFVEQLAQALKQQIRQEMEDIAERVARKILVEGAEVKGKEPEEGLLEESKPDWLKEALAESQRGKKK